MWQDVYVPSNVLKFKCKMCGQCCKKDWMVTLSKDEYIKQRETYKSVGELELYDANVKVLEKGTKEEYAKIYFGEKGCPFLTEDNRCSMQLRFGADILGNVCFNYPRRGVYTWNGIRVFMNYSCPCSLEMLDDKEPINIVKNPESLHLKVNDDMPWEKDFYKEYFDLEDKLLSIIQNRNFTVEERLLILLYIDRRFEPIELYDANFNEVEKFLEDLIDNKNREELLRKIHSFKHDANIQILVLLELIKDFQGKTHGILVDFLNNENLGFEDANRVSEELSHLFNSKCIGFNGEYQHILENYLCKFIFAQQFANSFRKGLFIVSIFYALVRLFSIIICFLENKSLDKDVLLKAISLVEEDFYHNESFAYRMLQKMRTVQTNTITIGSLIKI